MADTPLLDRYLSGDNRGTSASSNTPLIDQYLGAIKEPPPIQQTEANPPRLVGNVATPEETFSTRLGNMATSVGKGYLQSVGESAQSATDMMTSGGKNIAQGRLATGVGKLGLGAISYPLSLLTGAIHQFVEKPVTELTGSPDIGARAGFTAGAALPVVPTARAISRRMPTNAAVDAITSSVSSIELAEGLNRLKSNPRLSIMDVFPSVKQMGQKLILTEGQHQNKFVKFIEDRIGSRKGAIEDVYESTIGAPPNVLLKLNELKQNIKDAGKEINPIIETANPVDVTGVISNIDKKLKPGITSVISAGEPLPLGDMKKGLNEIRKYLTNDKTQRIDANSLHDFQSAIRATADKLSNSADGKDRSLAYHLMNVRNDLVSAIENAAPGYKSKLAKYRDEYQVQDAFDKGYLITKNRAGVWDDRPEFWEQWIKGASKEEREAAREGARVAFDDTINGTRHNARKGMDIPETPFNRQKIELLFGKKETDEMVSRLRDERSISEVNSDMIKNSQTAMRTKAHSKVDLPEREAGGVTAQLALLAEAAGTYVTGGVSGFGAAVMAPKIIGAAKHKYMDLPLGKAKNNRLTDLLTSTGDDRDAVIQMLEASLPQAKLSLSQRAKLLTNYNP